ncbi:hypothetical protein niasHT_008843 [Heterodera trifolii]|uniref:Uncharacterized protein n=1 Tax=Heterodera trifolii TaxID=157864 RepID=A0ABD2LY71_9BILA
MPKIDDIARNLRLRHKRSAFQSAVLLLSAKPTTVRSPKVAANKRRRPARPAQSKLPKCEVLVPSSDRSELEQPTQQKSIVRTSASLSDQRADETQQQQQLAQHQQLQQLMNDIDDCLGLSEQLPQETKRTTEMLSTLVNRIDQEVDQSEQTTSSLIHSSVLREPHSNFTSIRNATAAQTCGIDSTEWCENVERPEQTTSSLIHSSVLRESHSNFTSTENKRLVRVVIDEDESTDDQSPATCNKRTRTNRQKTIARLWKEEIYNGKFFFPR